MPAIPIASCIMRRPMPSERPVHVARHAAISSIYNTRIISAHSPRLLLCIISTANAMNPPTIHSRSVSRGASLRRLAAYRVTLHPRPSLHHDLPPSTKRVPPSRAVQTAMCRTFSSCRARIIARLPSSPPASAVFLASFPSSSVCVSFTFPMRFATSPMSCPHPIGLATAALSHTLQRSFTIRYVGLSSTAHASSLPWTSYLMPLPCAPTPTLTASTCGACKYAFAAASATADMVSPTCAGMYTNATVPSRSISVHISSIIMPHLPSVARPVRPPQ
eukprot:5822590-Prymnesium_polylepis.2